MPIYKHQRMCKEWYTLRRYHRRNAVDFRHNQQVSLFVSTFWQYRSRDFLYHSILPLLPPPDNTLRFDYLATKTHAIIVPSCGIDSVPADVSVHLASKTLGYSPLGTSKTSAGLSGGFPGGTIASFIAACEDVPLNRLLLSSSDWSLSPVPGARSPAPSLVYRLGPGSRTVGGIGLFGRVNRALVQRTAGLREYAHKEARLNGHGGGDCGAGASYGPAFTYTEFTPTGNTLVAFMLSLAMGFGFATLTFLAPVRVVSRPIPHPHRANLRHVFDGFSQVRWMFKRLVTQPGSGPADQYVLVIPP